jgi:TfoX/Sxy family transcriptional regulator of competence genes
MVKLGGADYAALLKKGGEPFDPMGTGRPMAETLLLPEREFRDRAHLAHWLAKSRDYVASLPVRAQSKAKPAKAASKRRRA